MHDSNTRWMERNGEWTHPAYGLVRRRSSSRWECLDPSGSLLGPFSSDDDAREALETVWDGWVRTSEVTWAHRYFGEIRQLPAGRWVATSLRGRRLLTRPDLLTAMNDLHHHVRWCGWISLGGLCTATLSLAILAATPSLGGLPAGALALLALASGLAVRSVSLAKPTELRLSHREFGGIMDGCLVLLLGGVWQMVAGHWHWVPDADTGKLALGFGAIGLVTGRALECLADIAMRPSNSVGYAGQQQKK